MKKTLTIVIALVLALSICFACVGCNNNRGNNDNPQNTPVTPTPGPGDNNTKEPTATGLEAKASIDSYIAAWLVNNASSTNIADDLTLKLKNLVSDRYSEDISSATVKLSNGEVVVTYTFKNKARATSNIKLPAANEGISAGTAYANTPDSSVNADLAVGKIINGLFLTINKAVEGVENFEDNGFAFDGTAYFDFHYGDSEQLVRYGLRLAGNIAKEAKDTYACIEVLQAANLSVIGGLYYNGADEKLYLNAGADRKVYIDKADINSIVVKIIEALSNGEENEEVVEPADAVPFYKQQVNSLADFLKTLNLDDNVAKIVSSVVNTVLKDVSVTRGTTSDKYQVKIDLELLLNSVVGIVENFLGDFTLDMLPEPLNQLDLASFQGIGGVLLVSADLSNEDGSLTGLELSYNCGKKDFRFNFKDKEAKVYGPINAAIGITNFNIGDGSNALKNLNEAEYNYFSPLNADVSVKVSVGEEVYNVNVVSDINPFALDEGVITFVVDNGDDAAWLTGKITTNDGSVVVAYDDQLVKFAFDQDLADVLLAKGVILAGEIVDGETVFKPLVDYIKDLIAMFSTAEEVAAADASAEEEESKANIMEIVQIISAAKDLLASWKDSGVLDYNLDQENLLSSYLEVKLDAVQYNQVMDLIATYLKSVIDPTLLPKFDENSAKVYVNVNKGEHAKQAYVTVKYGEWDIVVTVDASKLDSKLFSVEVKVNDAVYLAKVDASNEENIKVTYDAAGVKYVDLTLNAKNKSFDAHLYTKLEGENAVDHHFEGSLELGEKSLSLTLAANGTTINFRGSNPFFTVNEKTTSFGIPTFTAGVEFGWTLPGDESDVKVEVTLNAWGERTSDNYVAAGFDASKLEGEPTVEVEEIVDDILNAILSAIGTAQA